MSGDIQYTAPPPIEITRDTFTTMALSFLAGVAVGLLFSGVMRERQSARQEQAQAERVARLVIARIAGMHWAERDPADVKELGPSSNRISH